MKSKFVEHEKTCSMKPQSCKFCEQVIEHAQINDHYQMCGSKTFKCDKCQDYVKNVEKEAHYTEGYCDVIKESKDEKDRMETEKELKKF